MGLLSVESTRVKRCVIDGKVCSSGAGFQILHIALRPHPRAS